MTDDEIKRLESKVTALRAGAFDGYSLKQLAYEVPDLLREVKHLRAVIDIDNDRTAAVLQVLGIDLADQSATLGKSLPELVREALDRARKVLDGEALGQTHNAALDLASRACRSLRFSVSKDMLATTEVDYLGNKAAETCAMHIQNTLRRGGPKPKRTPAVGDIYDTHMPMEVIEIVGDAFVVRAPDAESDGATMLVTAEEMADWTYLGGKVVQVEPPKAETP